MFYFSMMAEEGFFFSSFFGLVFDKRKTRVRNGKERERKKEIISAGIHDCAFFF